MDMENFDALSPTMKYDIAKVQGDILQLAADKGYDMKEFIENYMTSDFCNNEMDSDCSFFHFKQAEVCLPYILDEKKCNMCKDELELDYRFIGMTYRFLVYYTGKKSKDIYKLIPPEELDELSFAYETYEIKDAAKEIADTILPKKQ